MIGAINPRGHRLLDTFFQEFHLITRIHHWNPTWAGGSHHDAKDRLAVWLLCAYGTRVPQNSSYYRTYDLLEGWIPGQAWADSFLPSQLSSRLLFGDVSKEFLEPGLYGYQFP